MVFGHDATESDLADLIRPFAKWTGALVRLRVCDSWAKKVRTAADLHALAPIFKHSPPPGNPREGETPDEWLGRVTTPASRLARAAVKIAACSGNPNLANKLGARKFIEQAKPLSFLAEGLIPCGVVTLLVGPRKSGKSTLLTELACVVASYAHGRDSAWAGFKIRGAEQPGLIVIFTGEDGDAIVSERLLSLAPDGTADRLMVLHATNHQELKARLAELEDQAVDLLIVDPLRQYLVGSENDSAGPSDLLGILGAFAQKTGAAVVVAHHIGKPTKIGSLDEVVGAIRGSSVIADRVRVILGMVQRDDGITGLGIAREGQRLLHNIPPSQPVFTDERALRFNPATQRHLPVDGSLPIGSEDACARVLAATARISGEGERITQTGKNGLWERRAPELAGMSRKAVRQEVAALIAAGQVSLDNYGQLRCA